METWPMASRLPTVAQCAASSGRELMNGTPARSRLTSTPPVSPTTARGISAHPAWSVRYPTLALAATAALSLCPGERTAPAYEALLQAKPTGPSDPTALDTPHFHPLSSSLPCSPVGR